MPHSFALYRSCVQASGQQEPTRAVRSRTAALLQVKEMQAAKLQKAVDAVRTSALKMDARSQQCSS